MDLRTIVASLLQSTSSVFDMCTSFLAKIKSVELGVILTFAWDIILYNTGKNIQQLRNNIFKKKLLTHVKDYCDKTG